MSNERDKKLEELEKKFENGVDVVKEIEQQYEYAKSKNYTNSSLKALELLVKVRGNAKPDDKNISIEESEIQLYESANVTGFGFWLNIGIANNWITDFEEDIRNSKLKYKELTWLVHMWKLGSIGRYGVPTKSAIDFYNKKNNGGKKLYKKIIDKNILNIKKESK